MGLGYTMLTDKEFYIGILGHPTSYKKVDKVTLYAEGLTGEYSSGIISIVKAIG
jgi:hypothetical protein